MEYDEIFLLLGSQREGRAEEVGPGQQFTGRVEVAGDQGVTLSRDRELAQTHPRASRQPVSVAWGPTRQSSPMMRGCGGRAEPPVDLTTAPGITTTRAPISTGDPFATMIAPSSTTQPGPMRTGPRTTAEPATNASGAIAGTGSSIGAMGQRCPTN